MIELLVWVNISDIWVLLITILRNVWMSNYSTDFICKLDSRYKNFDIMIIFYFLFTSCDRIISTQDKKWNTLFAQIGSVRQSLYSFIVACFFLSRCMYVYLK